MEFWLDSANPDEAAKLSDMGLLKGVTTNPSLLGSAPPPLDKLLQRLVDAQPGPVAVQVMGETAQDMIDQGKKLFDFNPDQIIVKIPVTKQGLVAIHKLKEMNIPTIGTIVFAPEQALTAAKAGADYVALYVGRLDKSGGNGIELLRSTAKIFQNYKVEAKILAASLSTLEQVEKCAEFGIHAITMKESLFQELLEDHPLTMESIKQFDRAWKAEDASLFKHKVIV